MAIRKILCPTDFSDGARNALLAAAKLAVDRSAELVILHVIDIPAIAYTSELVAAGLSQEHLFDAAGPPLEHALGEARAAGVQRVSSRLESGPAAEVILDLLADRSFDLCVIGTSGRTGLAHVLLGSIAEKVVRRAPCPTLTIRNDTTFALPHHVLCPVDFSASSRLAAELAAQLVQPGGAVTLLHVLELPTRYGGAIPDGDTARALAPHAAGYLDDWAAKLRQRCPDVRIRSRVGSPGAQILAALEHEPTVDLVCMGSHGRTGLRHMLLGSVAEKVVRHAKCPVLVAREA